MTSPSKKRYRCVAFDAVGTVIHAEPSVTEVYARIGRKYGASVTIDDVRSRFAKAISDRQRTLASSEEQEFEFWQDVVFQVLGNVSDRDSCFDELYRHFAQPSVWRIDADLNVLVETLHSEGVKLAIASNFDHRLNQVMDGHSALAKFHFRCISSEIGWRKPSHEFYDELVRLTGCEPSEILMVGDDFENDIIGANVVGIDTLLFSGGRTSPQPDRRIGRLADVLDWVQL